MDKVRRLFRDCGDSLYIGEAVSNTEHAIQAAYHAEKSNYDTPVVVAAFLHDIGHFLGRNGMGDYGVANHEGIGYQYLKDLGFSDEVTIPVKDHVMAKRFLVSNNKSYYNKLSDASKKTFEYQGGFLTSDEIHEFETSDYFTYALQVRECDDHGKTPGALNGKSEELFERYMEMAANLLLNTQ